MKLLRPNWVRLYTLCQLGELHPAFIWGCERSGLGRNEDAMRKGMAFVSLCKCATREGQRVFSCIHHAEPVSTWIRSTRRGRPVFHVFAHHTNARRLPERACVVGLHLHMHGARETELESRACVVGLNCLSKTAGRLSPTARAGVSLPALCPCLSLWGWQGRRLRLHVCRHLCLLTEPQFLSLSGSLR